MGGLRIITTNLSGGQSLQIVNSMNILKISYKMSNGNTDAGAFIGNANILDGAGNPINSTAIALGPGEGDTYQSENSNQPIDGLTLSCSAGTLRIVMTQG